MSKAIITVGIPASGKTTWANQYVQDHLGAVISCRDDIRFAHDLPYGIPEVEKYITTIQRVQINKAILDGHDVIIADTNIVKRFRDEAIDLCKSLGAEVKVKVFHIKLSTALERDSKRENPVGFDVIERFYSMMKDQIAWGFITDDIPKSRIKH